MFHNSMEDSFCKLSPSVMVPEAVIFLLRRRLFLLSDTFVFFTLSYA